jgi:hypothetical protein
VGRSEGITGSSRGGRGEQQATFCGCGGSEVGVLPLSQAFFGFLVEGVDCARCGGAGGDVMVGFQRRPFGSVATATISYEERACDSVMSMGEMLPARHPPVHRGGCVPVRSHSRRAL